MKLNEIVSKIKNLINKPQEEVEIWKPIKGFEGLYEISNMGRIRGLKSNKIISPTINQVTLSKNGIKKTIKVSRLVIQSFLNDVCSFSHIEHLNDDITDNRLSNLKLFDSKHTKCIQKDVQVLENEVWKDIPSYDGRYQVSNLGRIRSLNHKNPHIITYSIHHKSYLECRLYFNDNGILKMKSHKVHRIVAEAFIPNPENKPCVYQMSIENAHNSAELLINSNNCSIMNYMYKLYKIYYEQVYYFDTINNKVEKTIKKKRQPSTSCLIEKGKKRTEEENVNIEDVVMV